MCWLADLFKSKGSPITFIEGQIGGDEMRQKLVDLGFMIPLGMMDSIYYYTDAESWANILHDMSFKSNLYKPERFDCDDYAFKAYVTCRERYGLNTFGIVLGNTPAGYHGFNIVFTGTEFFLFEPNEGFGFGGMFPIGEHGYIPGMIVL